jgi:molybdate transport system substrate-binding protein
MVRQSLARAYALALVVLAGANACSKPASHAEVTVAAATSLREVLPEIARAYEASNPGHHVKATYAASGALKGQVEAGAPIDAVLFAGARPVDELIAEGKAEAATRHVVATNEMVLVARPGGPPLTFATLRALPRDAKLAIGDPRTVPAGEYARDYLVKLGEWDAIEGQSVLGANVAAVLVYARRGEAAAAIVYKTELRGITDLVVLDHATGPAAPHPEVVVAQVRGGAPEVIAFLGFVASPSGAAVFQSFGFGPP